MLTKAKTPYGINTVEIGTMRVRTLKLRVDNSTFPLAQLPLAVKSVYKGKYTILLYTGDATNPDTHCVIQSVGRLLKEHALAKHERKYAWCNPQLPVNVGEYMPVSIDDLI